MFEARILSGDWDKGTITLKGMPKDFVLSARNVIVLETVEHEPLRAKSKEKIKQILMQVGDVDEGGDYWGHDTNLGNIDKLVTDIICWLKEPK